MSPSSLSTVLQKGIETRNSQDNQVLLGSVDSGGSISKRDPLLMIFWPGREVVCLEERSGFGPTTCCVGSRGQRCHDFLVADSVVFGDSGNRLN